MKLRNALVMLVCFCASLLQSVVPFLLSLRDARPDLLLGVVLYLALHDEWVRGGALSLFAGYLADLGSGTPLGFYSFLAVVAFLALRLGFSAFKTDRGPRVAVLGFGASLVHSLLASVLYRSVLRGTVFKVHLASELWSAAATGLGALLVFAVLRRIDEGFLQGEHALGRGF